MPYTMDDFLREAAQRIAEDPRGRQIVLEHLSTEQRLEGIPPEQRLEGIPADQVLELVLTSERLAGLSPEEKARLMRRLLTVLGQPQTPPAPEN